MAVQTYKRGVSKQRLTTKQQAFVANWVACKRNGTRAAIAAGYPAKTAAVMACKLLQHPLVKRAIGKLENEVIEGCKQQLGIAYQRVIDTLNKDVRLLFDDEGCMIDPRDIPDELASIIDGIEIDQWTDKDGIVHRKMKVRTAPITPAQDMAFKLLGAYAPEKVESKNLNANIDYDKLCERPVGALAEDVIE